MTDCLSFRLLWSNLSGGLVTWCHCGRVKLKAAAQTDVWYVTCHWTCDLRSVNSFQTTLICFLLRLLRTKGEKNPFKRMMRVLWNYLPFQHIKNIAIISFANSKIKVMFLTKMYYTVCRCWSFSGLQGRWGLCRHSGEVVSASQGWHDFYSHSHFFAFL